jgi:hypothetical protein
LLVEFQELKISYAKVMIIIETKTEKIGQILSNFQDEILPLMDKKIKMSYEL